MKDLRCISLIRSTRKKRSMIAAVEVYKGAKASSSENVSYGKRKPSDILSYHLFHAE